MTNAPIDTSDHKNKPIEKTVGFINSNPDKDMPNLIEIILESEGYNLVSVHIEELEQNGKAAIVEFLEQTKTVILDLPAKPSKTLDFLKNQVRRLEEANDHKFIILSDPIHSIKEQAFGIQFLEKPFPIDDLLNAIKNEPQIKKEREV